MSAPMPYTLSPGRYLVELGITRPYVREILERGLFIQGWREVIFDASKLKETDGPHERFVGELAKPIRTVDVDGFTWSKVTPVELNVLGDLTYRLSPFPLEKGARYELRFIARMKSHPTKAEVKAALGEMAFTEVVLTALKRDMRVPGHPGTSATLWYGQALYEGPSSVITIDDPLCFEDVEKIA